MTIEIIGERPHRSRGFAKLAKNPRQISSSRSGISEHLLRRLQSALRRLRGLAQACYQRLDVRFDIMSQPIESREGIVERLERVTEFGTGRGAIDVAQSAAQALHDLAKIDRRNAWNLDAISEAFCALVGRIGHDVKSDDFEIRQ